MESLRYNPGMLLLRALTAGLAAAGGVALYIDPEWADIGLWTMIFADGLGHDVALPATTAFFALLSWRAATIAFGRCMALEVRDGTLTATTFWRSTKVPIQSLVDVRLEEKRTKWRTITRLVLRIAKEADIRTIRIPLGLTELSKFKYPKLVADLEALAGHAPRSGAAAPSDQVATDFDADAAIARYLARKSSEPVQQMPATATAASTAVPPSPTATRPSFGRKRA
jgi:hypothetical protein